MTPKEKAMQGKREKFGSRNPKCVICGEPDIIALTAIRENQLSQKQRTLLEEHHLAYRHEGGTIIVCLNCHAKLSFEQDACWPKKLKQEGRDTDTFLHAVTRATFDTLKVLFPDRRVRVFAGKLLKKLIEAISKGQTLYRQDIQKLFEEAFKCCLLDNSVFDKWPDWDLNGERNQ